MVQCRCLNLDGDRVPISENVAVRNRPGSRLSPQSRIRLVLITGIISPYRIPVFNELASRGDVDLRVIFLADTNPLTRQWLVYKDEIRFRYEVLPSYRFRAGGRSLVLNWGMTRALRRAEPAAIICGGYNDIASWRALAWARSHRVPFVLWAESNLHDQRRGHAAVEALKRAFVKRCDRFAVPGSASAQYLKTYGARDADIETAPNAVDTELFSRQAERARDDGGRARERLGLPARYFLFVGRLLPGKGIFDLVDAYQTLAPEIKSLTKLVFVGDGPSRQQLEQRARSAGPGSIQLAGFVHREQLGSYYGLADAFIFPTHSDPWGLVVNEAMACGLPVIATDVAGATADLVKDGWNGYVVRAGDIGGLAAAMKSISEHGELRNFMGRRSREHIENYSPAKCAEGLARAALAGQGVPIEE